LISLNILIAEQVLSTYIYVNFELASWNHPVLVSYEETFSDLSRSWTLDVCVERQTP
jgi:hypothetical protein